MTHGDGEHAKRVKRPRFWNIYIYELRDRDDISNERRVALLFGNNRGLAVQAAMGVDGMGYVDGVEINLPDPRQPPPPPPPTQLN